MYGPHLQTGGRYPVLRAFGIIYVLMAALALVSGVLAAGWALFGSPWNLGNRVMLALLAMAGSFFLIVGSLAVAEVIKLFMDVEHNTRIIARRSLGQITPPPSPDPAAMSNRMRELDDEETAEAALIRGH